MIKHTDNNAPLDYQNTTVKLSATEKYKFKNLRLKHTYLRKYNFTSIVLIFFICSIFGWLWEVLFHIITEGTFVNRGMLFGPWLPIYGFGGVLSLLIPKKISKNPINTFIIIAVISSVMEYATSWFFEYIKGVRWWDYSEYIFNINGRICLYGAVFFGFCGCFCIYILGPMLDDMIKKLPQKIILFLCIGFLFVFCFDLIYSNFKPNIGEGITYYSKSYIACNIDDFIAP